METLSPAIGVAAGLVFVLGSVSIGYVMLRCALPTSTSWSGWKRLATSGGVGALLGVAGAVVFAPLFFNPISNEQLLEYAALGGMGLFIFTGLASIVSRGIVRPGMAHYPLATQTTEPRMESSARATVSPQTPARATGVYKPSQLRANTQPTPPAKPMLREPTLENDVLSLLKEEEEASPTPRTENEEQPPRRRPMSELSDFGGFDETLAQLKRDLKDFNESVSSRPKKTAKKENP